MKKLLLIPICCIICVSGLFTWGNSYKEMVASDVTFYEMGDASLTIYDTLNESYMPKVDIGKMRDLAYLQKYYYAVDKKTGITGDYFNIDKLLATDVKVTTEGSGPKVLIFHTHGSELYADSKGINEGVIGCGNYLKKVLEDKYGIETLHITDIFDKENGKLNRDGAYERAEPRIKQVLHENPSIELVIDLHRDGVNENLRLIANDKGDTCAKIMLFNGLCQKWENGKLVKIDSLQNPNIPTNLALSLEMQLALNEINPALTRKIYLNAYRYSLHMKDKSLLIELGAQTNTYKEACNSIDRLAEALAKVCF